MADELQVQQGQSSSGAYGLTGAVIGGTGAGVAAHYLTKPKYASYGDIIKEAQDSADFSSKIEKAEGEEKTFLQAAKDVADARSNADKEFEEGLKAFKEANKDGVVKDDAFIALEKQQGEYLAKIKELEAAAGDSVTVVKKDPLAAIRQNTKKINELKTELDSLKASGASKESIKAVEEKIATASARLNKIYESIIESTNFKGTAEEIANAKTALRKELEGYSQIYMAAYDRYSVKTPAHKYMRIQSEIKSEQSAITEALKSIKSTTARGDFEGYDLAELYESRTRFSSRGLTAFDKRLDTIIKTEQRKSRGLETIIENYKKAADGGSTATSIWDRLAWLFTGKDLPSGDTSKAVEEFIKTLSPEEKKLLQGKEVTLETLEQLSKESKGRLEALNKAANTIRSSSYSVSRLTADLEAEKNALVKKYGKGTYVTEEGEIYRGTKKVGTVPKFEVPKFETELGELPKEIEVAGRPKSTELSEVRRNLAELNKQIEAAREKLPKGAVKNDEQLLADYLKEKCGGASSRNEFLDNQVKSKTEKFAKDFDAQFKRRFGFAEHSNWKIAGVAAAGALVIGGLASLFAPKNNS